MIVWWENREPRERLLIMLAVVIVLLAFGQQFVIRPILSAHAEAKSLHQRAAQGLDIVVADTQALLALPKTEPPAIAAPQNLSGDALRTALTTLAAQRGLEISRLQSTSDGGFSMSMENADPQQFFSWLAEAEAVFGAETENASITTTTNGQIRITIEFGGLPA